MNVPQSMFAPVYRLASRLGVLFIAVFLFLLFAVTGLIALYFLLREYLPREGAMGLIALAALVASVIAAWLATRRSRARRTPVLGNRAASWDTVIRQTVVQDPLGAAVAAVAAGLVLASAPEVGRLLHRLLGNRMPPS
jgi:hypothetical protein